MSDERHVETGIVAKADDGTVNEEAKFYWCGARVNKMEWAFTDPTHVILTLKRSTSIQPCRKCLVTIFNILAFELGVPPELK